MGNPQSQPAPEKIFQAVNAYHLSHALKGAIDLGLFTAIGEGHTDAKSLAMRCKASERGCRILCDFLTVHGLLTKSGGHWGLTPDSALFLTETSPMYMGTIGQFLLAAEMQAGYQDIAATVRKGGTVISEEGSVAPDNPIWVNFARNMPPIVAGAAMDVAEELGDGGDAHWKVLDIAAGHGLFGIEIAKKNPRAEIVALDWKAVLEVAQENAVRAGVRARYRTLAGSAFEVDFGSDYDVVLLPNFLHHFDYATCVSLLKKVHAALKPGGRVATIEFVPNDDRISPPAAATFALIMLASTRAGDAYTFKELESMATGAGFSSTRMVSLRRSPECLVISRR